MCGRKTHETKGGRGGTASAPSGLGNGNQTFARTGRNRSLQCSAAWQEEILFVSFVCFVVNPPSLCPAAFPFLNASVSNSNT